MANKQGMFNYKTPFEITPYCVELNNNRNKLKLVYFYYHISFTLLYDLLVMTTKRFDCILFMQTTRILSDLVIIVNPLIKNPFGTIEHWTSPMISPDISFTTSLHVEPKCSRSFGRPDCDFALWICEGCGATHWSILDPGHYCGNHVTGFYQVWVVPCQFHTIVISSGIHMGFAKTSKAIICYLVNHISSINRMHSSKFNSILLKYNWKSFLFI